MIEKCPCGSNKLLPECCGKFISGQSVAPTPEALMRSRYVAYTKADFDYIEKTMKDVAAKGFNKNEAKEAAKGIKWLGLRILSSFPASLQDQNRGYVEFIAQYQIQNKIQFLHEKSEFKKENNEWFYVNGQIIKTGRNDLCPCGSGKKYKKCCGS